MAVEVRIPTILRTFTGGAKAVQGDGDTLAAGDRRHRGPQPRPEGAAGRGRRTASLRQRLRQRRGRPVQPAGCSAPTADGDVVVVLPGRRRRLSGHPWRGTPRWPTRSATPRWSACPACRPVDSVRLWAKLEDRNPTGSIKDRAALQHDPGGRGRRHAAARRDDPGADQRQHRHLAGHGREAGRLPADLRDAGEHLARAQADPGHVGGGDRLLARRPADPTRPSGWPRNWPPSTPTG